MSGVSEDLQAKGRRTSRRLILGSGRIRIEPLREIPVLLAERRFDPTPALRRVGLDPHLFDNPENVISYGALDRLVEICVELTGCPHFGLGH